MPPRYSGVTNCNRDSIIRAVRAGIAAEYFGINHPMREVKTALFNDLIDKVVKLGPRSLYGVSMLNRDSGIDFLISTARTPRTRIWDKCELSWAAIHCVKEGPLFIVADALRSKVARLVDAPMEGIVDSFGISIHVR